MQLGSCRGALNRENSKCHFRKCDSTTDRPAVNAHPDLQALVVLERAADLKGALRGFLGTFIEHQSHAIAGRNFQDPIGRFSFLVLLGQANNPVEFINPGVLFVYGELGVADDVEKENVRDLKLDLLFNFSRHVNILWRPAVATCPVQ